MKNSKSQSDRETSGTANREFRVPHHPSMDGRHHLTWRTKPSRSTSRPQTEYMISTDRASSDDHDHELNVARRPESLPEPIASYSYLKGLSLGQDQNPFSHGDRSIPNRDLRISILSDKDNQKLDAQTTSNKIKSLQALQATANNIVHRNSPAQFGLQRGDTINLKGNPARSRSKRSGRRGPSPVSANVRPPSPVAGISLFDPSSNTIADAEPRRRRRKDFGRKVPAVGDEVSAAGTSMEEEQRGENIESFARLLRRLREKTNIVLIKRTQWRHEHQTVELSRHFLRDSTAALLAAMQHLLPDNTLQDDPDKTKSRRRRRRKKKRGQRGRAEPDLPSGETSDSSSPRPKLQIGLGGFDIDGDEVIVSDGTDDGDAASTIKPLHAAYLRDLETLKRQEAKVTSLMDELSSDEFLLGNLHEAVRKSMFSAAFASELRSEMLIGEDSPSESNVHTTSEVNIPPLLQDYFYQAGNAGIFLERLHELDFNYREGIAEREFLRDQGETLKVPDDEYDLNHQTARQHIERDLANARSEVDRLAGICEEAGLDPAEYRLTTAISEYAVSAQPPAQALPATIPGAQSIKKDRVQRSLSPPKTGQSSRQIQGWLSAIPDLAEEWVDASIYADVAGVPVLDRRPIENSGHSEQSLEEALAEAANTAISTFRVDEGESNHQNT